jgi:hypothetical protein
LIKFSLVSEAEPVPLVRDIEKAHKSPEESEEWVRRAVKLGIIADKVGIYQEMGEDFQRLFVRDFPPCVHGERKEHSLDVYLHSVDEALMNLSEIPSVRDWLLRAFTLKFRAQNGLRLYHQTEAGFSRLNAEFVEDYFKDYDEEAIVVSSAKHEKRTSPLASYMALLLRSD